MCRKTPLPPDDDIIHQGLIIKEKKGHRFFPVHTKMIFLNNQPFYLPIGKRSITVNGQRLFFPNNTDKGTENFLKALTTTMANLLLTGARIIEYFQGDCQSIPARIEHLDAQHGLPGVKPRHKHLAKKVA